MWLSEEALTAIGSSGRVRYHEQGELLYAEGSACSRRFWVVQKGAIRLLRLVIITIVCLLHLGTGIRFVVVVVAAAASKGSGHCRRA